MKKSAKIALSVTAVVAVGATALTYAYWSQTASIDNPFSTKSYGSSLVEKFNPEDGEDWQPGSEVDKVVMVENTGDTSLIVRARLDETWTRDDEDEAYKDSENDPYDVYTTYQDSATDGLYEEDGSIVTKNWSDSTLWVDGGDGWYYYSINLPAGETSDNWLESVTLLSDADMGYYADTCYVAGEKNEDGSTTWYEYDVAEGATFTAPAYFTVDETTKKAVAAEEDDEGAIFTAYSKIDRALDDEIPGYSGSDYVLTVTIETVQATQEAIDEVFDDMNMSAEVAAKMNWALADSDDATADADVDADPVVDVADET